MGRLSARYMNVDHTLRYVFLSIKNVIIAEGTVWIRPFMPNLPEIRLLWRIHTSVFSDDSEVFLVSRIKYRILSDMDDLIIYEELSERK